MHDDQPVRSEKVIIERDSNKSPVGIIVAIILILLLLFFVFSANPFKEASSGDGGQTNINVESPAPSALPSEDVTQ